MEAAVLHARVGLVRAVLGRDIGLTTQDGLDALGLGCPVEGHGAEEVAVVGDGDGVHPEGFHALDEFVEPVAAVEQGVFGMEVEMDELALARDGARAGIVRIHKMLWFVGHREPVRTRNG